MLSQSQLGATAGVELSNTCEFAFIDIILMNSGHDRARIGFCLCYAIDFWTRLGKGGHVWVALQKF